MNCNKEVLPNIHVYMYTLLPTIPVTSCECMHSASVLRNCMGAEMAENRLTSLALMYIHYDHKDSSSVVNLS